MRRAQEGQVHGAETNSQDTAGWNLLSLGNAQVDSRAAAPAASFF